MGLWDIELEVLQSGYKTVCGVDEAGRGPLAGPVCAAAVILPPGIEIKGLNDSKKLSEKKREELYAEITEKSLYYGIAFASVDEIEKLNILGATFLAMNRAISKLGIFPELALIDGNQSKGIDCNCRCIVGGDAKCASIAAASILAKVTRDRLMVEYDKEYPQYGFAKHKGYGTKAHKEALMRFGPCGIHRPSFLSKIFPEGSSWIRSLPAVSANSRPQNI
ncbi:MAG: ribonuclease HII [Clostridiales bacterium]|nr:ribonuclease HII [Clostridiales bacterium]